MYKKSNNYYKRKKEDFKDFIKKLELQALETAEERIPLYLDIGIKDAKIILDVGCGVGRVATYLQEKGHQVVGLDSCPEAMEITKARGLKLTYTANICILDEPPLFNVFHVILMMGNNLGVCGEEKKTEELLIRLNSFLKKEGLLIFSCRDPFHTDNPIHLEYHEKNRQKGRSPGLVRIRLVYKELRDEWWDLLLLDTVTAEKIVKKAGFTKIVLIQPKNSPIYYFVAQK